MFLFSLKPLSRIKIINELSVENLFCFFFEVIKQLVLSHRYMCLQILSILRFHSLEGSFQSLIFLFHNLYFIRKLQIQFLFHPIFKAFQQTDQNGILFLMIIECDNILIKFLIKQGFNFPTLITFNGFKYIFQLAILFRKLLIFF